MKKRIGNKSLSCAGSEHNLSDIRKSDALSILVRAGRSKETFSAPCNIGLHLVKQVERAQMSSEGIDDFLRRTTLRQIDIMAVLQKHGSITKAAHALGMSVANVSRASKRFEGNLGIKLFEGGRAKVHIAPRRMRNS